MSRAVPGSICTMRIATMMARRPLNRYLLRAAEAKNARTTANTTAQPTTITELRRFVKKLVSVTAMTKLCIVGCSGQKCGVSEITSERGLKAVLIIQYTGKNHTRENSSASPLAPRWRVQCGRRLLVTGRAPPPGRMSAVVVTGPHPISGVVARTRHSGR